MFGWGNPEKSEIENEYREYTRNIPYNAPSDLKNTLTRAAEDLKSKRMRIFEEKQRYVERKDSKVKEIERELKRETDRLNDQYKRELQQLQSRYSSKINDEQRQCDRETASVENSHSYELRNLRDKIKDAQKKIEEWQRNPKK